MSRWKAQFLEGGRAGLAEGGKSGPSGREEQLQAQIDELTTALGEAEFPLRVWKHSAERLVQQIFNHIRPHETLGMRRPVEIRQKDQQIQLSIKEK